MSKSKRQPNVQTGIRTLRHSVGVVLALMFVLAAVDTRAQNVRTFHFEGIPTTGPYVRCGQPVLKVPPPLPPNGLDNGVAEFDPHPNATVPIPLTPDKCDDKDIVLATTLARIFLTSFGLPFPNPRLLNIPLREVPVVNGFDGVREHIPSMGDVPPNPFPVTRSGPDFPITLGQWLSARGNMKVQCFPDGTAHVEAEFHNMIPNGIYSINSAWLSPSQGLVTIAFGGAPSAIVASSRGKGRFVRDLNFCPKDPAPDGTVLLFLTVFYRSDRDSAGATVFRALDTAIFRDRDGSLFTSTLPPGINGHVQLTIGINAEPLP